MAEGWEPANELEQRLLDAMQRSDQDGYFQVLGGTDLLLPLPLDENGAPTGGWATWIYEGRTYLLAFTSQQAMAATLGAHAGEFRTARLTDISAGWPDRTWWLAIDFGLPIAGYLPENFVSQITGIPAARPDQQITAAPAMVDQSATDPAAWAPVAHQPADDASPAADGAAAPGGGGTTDDTVSPGDGPTGAGTATGPGGATTPGDAFAPGTAADDSRTAGYATAPGNDGATADTAPGSGTAFADRAAYEGPVGGDGQAGGSPAAPGGFQPANEAEAALLASATTNDRKAFMDALLSSYVLVPVPETAPGSLTVTEPGFPWPRIERDGRPQVPVFTSPERMRERVGDARYAVAPFVLVIEAWPDRNLWLALNPDTPIGATLDGDRILELATWTRETHLAERLGVQPPSPAPADGASAAPAPAAGAAPPDAPPAGAGASPAVVAAAQVAPDAGQAPDPPSAAQGQPPAQVDDTEPVTDGAQQDPTTYGGVVPATEPPAQHNQPASDDQAIPAGQDTIDDRETSDSIATPGGRVVPDDHAVADEHLALQEQDAPGRQATADAHPAPESQHGPDDQAARDEYAAPEGPAAPGRQAMSDVHRASDAQTTGQDTPDGQAAPDEYAVPEDRDALSGGSEADAEVDAEPSGEAVPASEVHAASATATGPADEPMPTGGDGDRADTPAVDTADSAGGDDQDEHPDWPPVPAPEGEPAPELVPGLTFPADLQKPLPDDQVPFYLDRHFDRVGGYVHRVADGPVRADDLRHAISLGGEPGGPVHVIRWHVEASRLVPQLDAVRSPIDPELVEYRIATTRLPHGAELYRVGADGAASAIAIFNADQHRWHQLL